MRSYRITEIAISTSETFSYIVTIVCDACVSIMVSMQRSGINAVESILSLHFLRGSRINFRTSGL